jgi:hypothetical protein
MPNAADVDERPKEVPRPHVGQEADPSPLCQTSCTRRAINRAPRCDHPYRSRPMQGQATHRLTSRRSTKRVGPVAVAVAVAVSVAVGLFITSCGVAPLAGHARISAAGTSEVAGTVAGTPGNSSIESEQVVAAWVAAQQAFDSAALSADPSTPGLAATTVPPQIDASRSLLEQMSEAGERAEGVVRFGTPHVVSARATLAEVRSCVHDAEIVVSATSGVPVAGVQGEVDYELFESTMESTPSGWKLMTQTVGAGACTGR